MKRIRGGSSPLRESKYKAHHAITAHNKAVRAARLKRQAERRAAKKLALKEAV